MSTTTIIRQIRALLKDTLQTNGLTTEEYDTSNKFPLEDDFVDSSTIVVYQNETELDEDDWSYTSATNSVTISPITSGVSLNSEDTIEITYSYYKKYSDTEIKGYIESALLKLTEHDYKKLFKWDTTTETIKTVNGINPTRKEEYMIASITAVLIDPKNISIRTKDFSLSAEENKSRSDQISEIISRFQNFIGEIEFIEEDEV